MKTVSMFTLTLFLLFVLFFLNASGEKDTQSTLPLPEGAKFRIGQGTLKEIAYFPDGTRFAVASSIGVRIYDSLTGKELNQLTGSTNRTAGFGSIRFSPDEKTIATEGPDKTVLLWDVSTEQLLWSLADDEKGFYNARFSPNGHIVATACADKPIYSDGTVQLWNARTGEYLRTLTKSNHFRSLLSRMVFSPDSRTLATWGYSDLELSDVDTGQHLKTVTPFGESGIKDVRFSPDGRTLATWSYRQVALWDIDTGEHLRTLDAAYESYTDNKIKDVRFSPDGKKFVILRSIRLNRSWRGSSWVGNVGIVYLWDVSTETGKHLQKPTQQYTDKGFSSISFSPNGKILATGGSSDGKVYLWDANTGKYLRSLVGSESNICFSPNGKILAASGSDGTIHLWSATTGQNLIKLSGHTGRVSTFSFSPDGITILSKGSDETVRLWNVITGELLKTLTGYMNDIYAVSFAPDGKIIASNWTTNSGSGSNTTVQLWNATTGKPLKKLNVPPYVSAANLCFSGDGKTIGSWNRSNVIFWAVKTGEILEHFVQHEDSRYNGEVLNVSLPNGETMAIEVPVTLKSENSISRVADITIGQFPNSFYRFSDGVSFSPDGEIIAIATYGATEGDMSRLHLWNTSIGQILKTIESLSGIHPVSFSPDGKTVAASYSDYSDVDLWDVATGQHLNTLSGHLSMPYCGGGTVSMIRFSPDGDMIATGSGDTTIRLWSTGTGKHLKTFTGHMAGVNSVAFSPDGKTLASGSSDGTILLWEVP